jgi:hypothetical protein
MIGRNYCDGASGNLALPDALGFGDSFGSGFVAEAGWTPESKKEELREAVRG